MNTYPKIGSVSHGTMRNEDLLETFADELELMAKPCDHPGNKETYTGIVAKARATDPDGADASEIISDLFDALDELAPPYCYFGSHPGDSSDYGFWPDMNSLECAVQDGEVTKLGGYPDDDAKPGEYMIVNDHGNVTFGYVSLNERKWCTIWDCV